VQFQTEEEVIRMANDTPFGLAAYAFTYVAFTRSPLQ
jgi:acyl-CoA reductase-like NAD-dependent aldehyde dehydrogenase